MQNVLDNLCRCFGTDGQNATGPSTASTPLETLCSPDSITLRDASSSSHSVPSTPDMKRRTRSLALQDSQWDALFRPSGAKTNSRRNTADTVAHAQAVAKAKLVAATAQRTTTKRKKRQRAEDIFRSRDSNSHKRRGPPNPISRFLTKHPVIANSLCFATPINESDDKDEDSPVAKDHTTNNSVMSDSHNCDETVSSTVYYERTKLAGLQQTNPPMPLYNSFQVCDDIHRIVESRSHSSTRLRKATHDNIPAMTTSSSSSSSSQGINKEETLV